MPRAARGGWGCFLRRGAHGLQALPSEGHFSGARPLARPSCPVRSNAAARPRGATPRLPRCR